MLFSPGFSHGSDLGVGDQRTRRKSIFLTTTLEVASGWVQLRHQQSLTAVDRNRHDDADPKARAVGRRLLRTGQRQAGRLAYVSVCAFISRRSTCSPSSDTAESVVVLGLVNEFIHGRNRSRSQKHDYVSKSLNAELLRVQRQVKALKLRGLALPTKTAATAATVSKAISSRRHAS